jgi:hypothetical protein
VGGVWPRKSRNQVEPSMRGKKTKGDFQTWKYHDDGFFGFYQQFVVSPQKISPFWICQSIIVVDGFLDLKPNECESIMLLMGSWIWSQMNVKVSCCWWVLGFEAEWMWKYHVDGFFGFEAEWMWKYHVVDGFLDLKLNECESIMLMGSWIGSRMNVKVSCCWWVLGFEAKWMWNYHVDGFLDWKPNECERLFEAEWMWKVIWSQMNVKVSCWWVLGLEAEWMWKYHVVDGFLDLKPNECESIMLMGSWIGSRMKVKVSCYLKPNECESVMLMGSWIGSRMNVKVWCCWWVLGFEAEWMWKYHVDRFLELNPNEQMT